MAAVSERLGGIGARTSSETGIWSWITTVDHKRIGLLYIFTACVFFLCGGIEAFMMRLQLAQPNGHVVSQSLFNELFTMHGLTMIFLAVMPVSIGFINFIVPLQLGARDVAFPRLNALSYWLFLAGGLFLNSSWLLGGAPNAGWFNYSPISAVQFNPGHGIDFYAIGLQLAGIGTLLSGVNFLVTILNMRAPGMSLMKMPMFCWTTLVTSVLILFAFPVFTVNLFLLMLDRLFNTGFFNVAAGGYPLLWSQLFWVFGHPEVYILILPAFGVISEVVPTMARKPLFGYTSMVFATLVIGLLAFMVWSHHMFTMGFGATVNSVFALSTMTIAVPTGVKIFNWMGTMWGGRLRMTTSMLYVFGFLICFVIGGLSGVMLASAPADFQYNDSYFVVAHIHYVLIGGSLFAVLAAAYYWFPKMSGRFLDETLGRVNFWLVFIGFNVTFFPFHILGLLGMPRRVSTYPANLGLHFWNTVSTIGVFILASGFIVFAYNLFQSMAAGRESSADPWDGRTLEWAISSPPPVYNFARVPHVFSRDAWWTAKQENNGKLVPAEEHHHGDGVPGRIHMPSPTALPVLIAAGLTVAGYGTLYKVSWVLAIGIVIAFYGIYRSMFEVDKGIFVEPKGETE